MAAERVEITNYERWGNLVKTWATGVDHVGDGNAYPVPRTLDEFDRQLKQAQVGATIPKRIKAIQFVQANEETLLVRLPPKEMIEDSEGRLNGGQDYVLPAFYSRVFGGADLTVPDGEKMRFHAERIGDYTISNCA